jgi:hypothetical protein
MAETTEYRRGMVMALFANAMNALEAEVDRPDAAFGVPGDLLQDLNADVSRLLERNSLNTSEARMGYGEHFDGSYERS